MWRRLSRPEASCLSSWVSLVTEFLSRRTDPVLSASSLDTNGNSLGCSETVPTLPFPLVRLSQGGASEESGTGPILTSLRLALKMRSTGSTQKTGPTAISGPRWRPALYQPLTMLQTVDLGRPLALKWMPAAQQDGRGLEGFPACLDPVLWTARRNRVSRGSLAQWRCA
jgi:hypothetical protein